MLEVVILILTTYWFISFFSQPILPGIMHTGGFIYMLAAGIVVLILVKFLSADKVHALLPY